MGHKIITAVYNAGNFFERYVKSIEALDYVDFEVVVVDDASTDGTADNAERACSRNGWCFIANETNRGALYNQVAGIRALNCDLDDVLVFVDGDDQLAHSHVLDCLDHYYGEGAKLTYGQYQPVPDSRTCDLAAPFPSGVIEHGNFRELTARGGGVWWNHLRTFKYELFAQLTDDDFIDAEGGWYKTATDAALMFPCLELAAPDITFIPEILYYYTSDNQISDWRRWPKQCDSDHLHILAREPKNARS